MKQLFEIETDRSEFLDEFRELARKYKVKLREWNLDKSSSPSPSGDPYFDNPKNIINILKGAKQVDQGEADEMTREQIREILGM